MMRWLFRLLWMVALVTLWGCSTAAPMSPELLALSADLRETPRVAAGENFVLAVKDGKVYGWGGNDSVLVKEKGKRVSWEVPIIIPIPEYVVSIAATRVHAVALTREGNVWTWGNNYSGNLSILQNASEKERRFRSSRIWKVAPFKLDMLSRVKKISTSADRNIALTETGEAWVWGAFNAVEEPGRSSQPSPPQLLKVGEKIKDVGTGVGAFYLKTVSGRDLLIGNKLQFGLGESIGEIGGEKIFETNIKECEVNNVVVFISLFITCSNGNVYAAGDNSSGVLGIGNKRPQEHPVRNSHLKEVTKVAGSNPSIAILESGKLKGWGDSHYGLPGFGFITKKKPQSIKFPQKALDVVSYHFYAYVVGADGKIYRWISGESRWLEGLHKFFDDYEFVSLKDQDGQDFVLF